METRKNTGFGVLIGVGLMLVGCGNDKAKQLEGSWRATHCMETAGGAESTRSNLSFQGKTVNLKRVTYSDGYCSASKEKKVVRVQGTYSVDGDKINAEFRKAHVYYTFVDMNELSLAGLSAIRFGGVSNWKLNEERDVTYSLNGVDVSRDELQQNYGTVKFDVENKKLKIIPENNQGETYEFDRE